jgi:hypothetical protein
MEPEIKDTLKLYDELIAGGCTESQARVQATQMGYVSYTITSALSNIEKDLKAIEKDLIWMKIIGGAMSVTFFGNLVKSCWT